MKPSAIRLILAYLMVFVVVQSQPIVELRADSSTVLKVLILQPNLNGKPEMGYLRQGLVDMLTTRLAHPEKVFIVTPDFEMPKDVVTLQQALELAARAGADRVVFGSLTLLGNRISTDLRMADSVRGEVLLAFSRSGEDASALIEHADSFAAEADAKVFRLGEGSSNSAQKAVAQPVQSTPAPDQTHQHPEKLLQQPMELQGGGRLDGEGEGAMLLGAGHAVRGPNIEDQVQGVATGDVDGDGFPEAVIAGRSTIWIYKFINNRFAKSATIEGSGNYIGLDAADVNGNGKDEIFVTNFDDQSGRAISFVLEQVGGKFERLDQQMGYYFRAMNVPLRGRVLFGQRQGFEGIFQDGIYEMVWEEGGYRRGARLKTPRRQNIFGMGLGVLPHSPEQMIFVYNSATQVQIMDGAGRQEWIGPEGYGVGANLVKIESKEDLSGFESFYLPGRIEIADLDGDGKDEAVVIRNEDLSSNVLKRTRLFKNGRLEVFKSDELGMAARLRTRYLPKFISDFAITDLDRDHNPEILTAVVQKTNNVLSKGRSHLYLFKLNGLMAGDAAAQ